MGGVDLSFESEGKKKSKRNDVLALVAMLFFTCVLFRGVFLAEGAQVLGKPEGDGRTQFFCWRVYGFERLARGSFPLWNPYVFLGMAYVGNLQSEMFYPANYLLLFLPRDWALNLGVMLNLLLAGLFTYLLGKRLGLGPAGALVASLIFMYGGPQFLRIYEGHWVHLCAITWIPLLLLATEMVARRARPSYALLGAVAVAMQMFAGHPQYLFYSAVAALIYFVLRMSLASPCPHRTREVLKRFGLFACIFAVAIVLSAVPFSVDGVTLRIPQERATGVSVDQPVFSSPREASAVVRSRRVRRRPARALLGAL